MATMWQSSAAVLLRMSTSSARGQRSRVRRQRTRCFSGGQVRDMEAMRVSFAVPYRCEFGQHIALVGSDEYLGDWDAQRAKPMNWTNGDVWTVDLELPPMPGLQLQYKYVVRNGDGSVARWMAGDNFEILTSVNQAEQPGALRVSDTWDASKHAIEIVELIAARQAAWQSLPEVNAVSAFSASSCASSSRGDALVDEVVVMAMAAEQALRALDVAIACSMELADSIDDPTSAQALAADRVVAAAASKAVAMTKALKAADPDYDIRLLGSGPV